MLFNLYRVLQNMHYYVYDHVFFSLLSTEIRDFYRRDVEQAGEVKSLILQGDIGGGLVLERQISLPKDTPKVFRIDSAIVSSKVGAGSGGYSRFAFIDTITLTCCIT